MNNKHQNKKVIIYCRVSSDDQVETGLSIEVQEQRCRAESFAKDYEIVEVITDKAESAKSLDRPGIQEAFRLLESGKADMLMVLKLDRLTRSVKDLGAILEKVEAEKWTICAVLESFDTSTAGGRLQMHILMSVSQWEREVIAERTKAALEQKKARGEKIGGKRQFGFEIVQENNGKKTVKKIIENKREQKAISLIIELRNTGFTYQAIAKELTRRKIKNSYGQCRWSLSSIHRILKRANRLPSRKGRNDKGKKRSYKAPKNSMH